MQTQHGHVHSHPPTSHVHTCINTRTRPPRKHTHASTLAKSINGKHIHQHSHPPTSHAHKCINTTNASGTTLDAYAHTCINTMNASHAHTWTHMHNAYAHSTCMGNAHAHTHTTHTHTAHAQRCTHMVAHAKRTCTHAHTAHAQRVSDSFWALYGRCVAGECPPFFLFRAVAGRGHGRPSIAILCFRGSGIYFGCFERHAG
jgi:hypothetical protein